MTNDSAAGPTRISRLLVRLRPVCNPGTYVFATADCNAVIDTRDCLCVMHEAEGLSIIAELAHLPDGVRASDYRAAWITLTVDSQLEDIWLTAAVSRCRAHANISCNIIAASGTTTCSCRWLRPAASWHCSRAFSAKRRMALPTRLIPRCNNAWRFSKSSSARALDSALTAAPEEKRLHAKAQRRKKYAAVRYSMSYLCALAALREAGLLPSSLQSLPAVKTY